MSIVEGGVSEATPNIHLCSVGIQIYCSSYM